MKGKRQEGTIDKDLQRLIEDLTLSTKVDHPKYSYEVDAYVNEVSNKVILDFLRVLFCRLQPFYKPEVLLRFIDELTVGDMDEMRKVFGEDVPLCDWNFWRDMYIKTERKQNGDVISPIGLTAEKEKEKQKGKNGKRSSKQQT